MNPILPLSERVPDCEVRLFDGRLYFYGSYDGDPSQVYCSDRLHVYSTDDLVHFTDHGVVITAASTGSPNALIYAPDCVFYNGKYYLYFACSDNRNYVAESDRPEGPFTDCTELQLPVNQIDPAVLVDDDGSAWLYWGQFQCHAAKLCPDMRSIEPDSYVPVVLDEYAHGFHEGPSIRKIDGQYLLVYSDLARGRATCLSYAVGPTPVGPFEKQGVLLDVAEGDPESWNNHGSVFPFGDRWYICGHCSSGCREGQRRTWVEPLIRENGRFLEAEMTTQGAQPPLDPKVPLLAVRSCCLRGKVRMDPSARFLNRLETGSIAGYRYFEFHGEQSMELQVATQFDGCGLRVRLDAPDGPVLFEAPIPRTGGWLTGGYDGFSSITGRFAPVQGTHAVYIESVSTERRFFALQSFRFA